MNHARITRNGKTTVENKSHAVLKMKFQRFLFRLGLNFFPLTRRGFFSTIPLPYFELILLRIFFRIGHDNKGGFAGWYLDWVSVRTNKFYHMFKADRWLDLKEANGKLECDLYPKPKESEGSVPFIFHLII